MNRDPFSNNQVRFDRTDVTGRFIPLYIPKETPRWNYVAAFFMMVLFGAYLGHVFL